MPRYAEVPSKVFRVDLPSTPGAEVWGPGELDYWDETRIRSRSQRTEVNPVTGQTLTIVDSAVFEYELLHTFLENPDSEWNLFDENDQPYERSRETIDRIFSRGKEVRKDRNHLIEKLAREFFPEMVERAPTALKTADGENQSAEGNGAISHSDEMTASEEDLPQDNLKMLNPNSSENSNQPIGSTPTLTEA